MRQSEFDEFLPLFEEANQRYLRGDLVGALSLATEGQERFPDERAPLYYLRATLKARMDDPAGALELLTESLSQGYWYPDSRWASDAFNKLQTKPEFIRQRTLSNMREAEAQAQAKSQLTVLLPKALAAAKAAASAAANTAGSSAETAVSPNVPAVTAAPASAVTNTAAPTDAGASTGTAASADTITNTAASTNVGASTGTTSPASSVTNTAAPTDAGASTGTTSPASPVTNTAAPAVTTPNAATSTNDTKWPLLMALHGSGYGTRHDSAYWQAVTSQDWLLGMPQSSQITGYESYAWSDYATSEIDLASHYDVLRQQYPVDTSRVVIAGKSQGAETAIRLVLSGMIPACGFIAIVPNGPMMLRAAEWEPLVQNASRDLRGYVLIGGREAHFAASGRRLVEMLRTRGIVCALDYHPSVRYEYPINFRSWLSFMLDFVTKKSGSSEAK